MAVTAKVNLITTDVIALELGAATPPSRAFVFISKKRGFKNG